MVLVSCYSLSIGLGAVAILKIVVLMQFKAHLANCIFSSKDCSKHFIDTDYQIGIKRRKLLPLAVPTIFPDYPKYLQATSEKKHEGKIFKIISLGL